MSSEPPKTTTTRNPFGSLEKEKRRPAVGVVVDRRRPTEEEEEDQQYSWGKIRVRRWYLRGPFARMAGTSPGPQSGVEGRAFAMMA